MDVTVVIAIFLTNRGFYLSDLCYCTFVDRGKNLRYSAGVATRCSQGEPRKARSHCTQSSLVYMSKLRSQIKNNSL
ncbi:MAG: hypothetical protein HC903_30190 [Methylacidiphilales bacterium]|nr:hypothetical protein [Candidatus Methylacidiphilales bacterium]